MSRPKMTKPIVLPIVLTIVEPMELSVEALKAGLDAWRTELEAEIERRRQEIARGTMAALARIIVNTPGLTSIVVRGYTPSWNDGETCTHSQDDPYLNGFTTYGAEQSTFLLDGTAREWAPEEEEAFAAVSQIIDGLEDILRGMFDTNWAVLVKRLDDGTIGWLKIDYSCDY